MTSNELEIFKQSILDEVRVMMQTTGQVTQYIGARYVPLFAEPLEWSNTKEYEPLTIVLHQGNSFTSRQFVPKGIDISNTDFWANTGNYNAQIEQYRKEVKAYDARITSNTNAINHEVSRAQEAEQALQENIVAYSNDYFSNKIKTKLAINRFPFTYSGFYLQGLAIDGDNVYIALHSTNLPSIKSKIIKCSGFTNKTLVYQNEVTVPNVTHVNSLCVHNNILYTCGIQSNESQYTSNRGYIDRFDLSTFKALEPIVFPCSGGLSDITVWTSGDITFIGGSANDNNGYVVSELVDGVVSSIYTYNKMPTHINFRQGGCFYHNQYYFSLNSGSGYSNAYLQIYLMNNNSPCAVITTDISADIECEDICITNGNIYILSWQGIHEITNINQYLPQFLALTNGAPTNLISCVNNAPENNIKLKYISTSDSYTLGKNGAGPLKWKFNRKIFTGNNVYIAGEIENGRTVILPFEQTVIDTHPAYEAQYFVGDIESDYSDNNANNLRFKIYVAKINTDGSYSRTTNNSADSAIKLTNLRIYSSEYV